MCADQQPAAGSAWALARQQHGVVSRRQLLDLGLSRRAIQHRLARGRLHSVALGVYAVGRPDIGRRGRWMAAVLSCGPTAALSHHSAGALWGIARGGSDPIEISIGSASSIRREGMRIHRRAALTSSDRCVRGGIPVTSLLRTMLDLATVLQDARLDRLVNEADRLDLIDPPTLRARLDLHEGQPGVARLRARLDRTTFRLTDSELERRFLPIAAEAGLPPPLTQQVLNGFRVDFHWPDLDLVVETDGLRYHRTPAQQAKDQRRDQAHASTGLRTLRFSHAQVRFEPDHVRSVLRSVARLARTGRHDVG